MSPSGEVQELKALFATPARSPSRESALPLTRIAKFGVADENSRLAAQGRLEKEDRLRQRERDSLDRLAKAQANRAAITETNARAKLHQELTREKNQNLVRSIRATEAEWQVEREQAQEGFRAGARKRVLVANALDARLDAQEEAADLQERVEGSAMRQEILRHVEETRERKLIENRDNALAVRENTQRAVAEAQAKAAAAKKRQAEAKRSDAEVLKQEREQNRQVQLTRASIAKQAVAAAQPHSLVICTTYHKHELTSIVCSPQAWSTRDQKDKNMEEMVREKKLFVTRDKKERAIDYTVADEKARQLELKRDSVEKRYRSQFAPQPEASKWDSAPLRRYYG